MITSITMLSQHLQSDNITTNCMTLDIPILDKLLRNLLCIPGILIPFQQVSKKVQTFKA